MHRRFVLLWLAAVAALVVALLGLRAWFAPSYSSSVVSLAAADLGVGLQDFTGPEPSGSSMLGTDTYLWERRSDALAVERLVYVRSEMRLCWSVHKGRTWHDNGCVSTVRHEY